MKRWYLCCAGRGLSWCWPSFCSRACSAARPIILPSALIDKPAPRIDLAGAGRADAGLHAAPIWRRPCHGGQFLRHLVRALPDGERATDGAVQDAGHHALWLSIMEGQASQARAAPSSTRWAIPSRRIVRGYRWRPGINGACTACPKPMWWMARASSASSWWATLTARSAVTGPAAARNRKGQGRRLKDFPNPVLSRCGPCRSAPHPYCRQQPPARPRTAGYAAAPAAFAAALEEVWRYRLCAPAAEADGACGKARPPRRSQRPRPGMGQHIDITV